MDLEPKRKARGASGLGDMFASCCLRVFRVAAASGAASVPALIDGGSSGWKPRRQETWSFAIDWSSSRRNRQLPPWTRGTEIRSASPMPASAPLAAAGGTGDKRTQGGQCHTDQSQPVVHCSLPEIFFCSVSIFRPVVQR